MPDDTPDDVGSDVFDGDAGDALAVADADALLDVADAAIVAGLEGRPPTLPPLDSLPPALRERRAAFVTLEVDGDLNGCIGTLEATDPLAWAVARNAWSSAFSDPRLPPLRRADYDRLEIEVSVLSPMARVDVDTREELLRELRPNVDGLLIRAGHRRAVFLPAVWEKLPDPRSFLEHLERKAGLAPGRWPRGLEAFRFTATKYCRKTGQRLR